MDWFGAGETGTIAISACPPGIRVWMTLYLFTCCNARALLLVSIKNKTFNCALKETKMSRDQLYDEQAHPVCSTLLQQRVHLEKVVAKFSP